MEEPVEMIRPIYEAVLAAPDADVGQIYEKVYIKGWDGSWKGWKKNGSIILRRLPDTFEMTIDTLIRQCEKNTYENNWEMQSGWYKGNVSCSFLLFWQLIV